MNFSAPATYLLKQDINKTYPKAVYGKSVYIFDDQNKQYLDGSSGAMAASMGHGNQEIAEAIKEQASKIGFVYRTQFTSEPAEKLAKKLAELAPGSLNTTFFVNSGSEASELSIRAAINHWRQTGNDKKTKILSRGSSYHGMTMGALSLSGHEGRRPDYGPLLHPFPVAPPAYSYRYKENSEAEKDYAIRAAENFRAEIIRADPETVAAIIIEPIVGAAGGVLVPPKGYLKQLRQICDDLNVLMIVDEVITGIGRTGDWFAVEHEEVVPDILTLGKGLSGGYAPYAAMMLADHVVQTISAGTGQSPFGHTFSANPIGAATCLKVLEIMERDQLLQNVKDRGAQLKSGLEDLAKEFPQLADIRGRGLLWGFEFVVDRFSKKAPDSSFNASAQFVEKCFSEGLIVYPAGIAPLNNAIIISPPIIISESQIEELLRKLRKALDAMSDEFKAWK